MHILLIIALILLTYWYLKTDFDRTPNEFKRQWLWQRMGLAVIVLLIALTAMGRLHWIGAIVGSLIPAAKMLYDTFKRKPVDNKDNQTNNAQPDLNLTREQALQILGFKSGSTPTIEAIKTAHKQLMQKVHPDRGGNDFLAAQLNAAKDLLTKE